MAIDLSGINVTHARQKRSLGNKLVFVLLIMAALFYVAWNVGPVYYEHYSLQDKVTEFCRTPRYLASDEQLDWVARLPAARTMYRLAIVMPECGDGDIASVEIVSAGPAEARLYFEVVLESGRNVVVFLDEPADRWYRQSA